MKKGSLLKICMGVALALSLIFGTGNALLFAEQGEATSPFPCPKWPECLDRTSEISTFKGTVKAIYPPVAVLETDEAELYFRLGPRWFWKAMGYALKQGEEVEIQGYRFNNMIIPVVIKTKTQDIILRDKNGIPLWRRYKKGKGRMGWGGYGMGMRPRGHLPPR